MYSNLRKFETCLKWIIVKWKEFPLANWVGIIAKVSQEFISNHQAIGVFSIVSNQSTKLRALFDLIRPPTNQIISLAKQLNFSYTFLDKKFEPLS